MLRHGKPLLCWIAACGALACTPDRQRDTAAGRDSGAAEAADGPAQARADAADAGAMDVGPVEAPVPDAATADAAGATSFAEWPLPDPTTQGAPGSQSYDVTAPDVVVDKVTHLEWQRNVDGRSFPWREANDHCARLVLAGHDDWRLPTRIELVSIVDFTRHAPAVDTAAFPGTPSEWFWTSSTLPDQPGFAWYIYFETGFTNFHDQDATYRVRCVRAPGGAAPSGPRYAVANGTARDTRTGLTWQQAAEEATFPWAEAKAYCARLGLAGGGWRLPSMKELQSLVDDSRAGPAIDEAVFPETASEPYWTATPVSGDPTSAWRVSFEHGYTYDANVIYTYHARCVR